MRTLGRVFLLLLTLWGSLVPTSATFSYQFIHISDIHYDEYYVPGSPTHCEFGSTGMGCCRSTSVPLKPPGKASKWGDFGCDSPLLLVNSTLQWIKENLEYDFVIYTGDTVNHHDVTQTWPHNFGAIKTITYLLQTLEKPIFQVLGNHDTYPIDQLWGVKPVVTEVGTLWDNDDLTNGAGVRNFSVGGYYETYGFCALNSLWYDTNNLAEKLDPSKDWGGQYAWAKPRLDGCFVIAHIAPRAGEASKDFNEFMRQANPRYELYGHSHCDQFVLINGTRRLRVGLLAPSIVPSGHFPGVRQFQYAGNLSAGNITLLDYKQFHLNLTEQILNPAKFIGYRFWYSARQAYGLEDLSAESFLNFTQRMVTNQTLFQAYCDNYAPPSTSCNKASMLCDIDHTLCNKQK